MAGAAQTTRRTRAAGVGLSLVLHLVVLSWLGLRAVQPLRTQAPEEPPPLTVELVRPQATAAAPASPKPRAPAPRPVEPVVVARPRPAAPVPRPLTPRPLPLPPVPSRGGSGADTGAGLVAGAGAGAGGPGARPAPGPLPGTEMQGDLRGFLRGTVGCSHEQYLRLSPTERARCDAGFATALKTAPRIPLPDDKLAGFARQADANERRRARREGSLEQPFTGCEVGSAAADKGLGCLPAGAMHTVAKF